MKYRSGYRKVKTLRKYVNGKPTNITKANVASDTDYIEKYLSDECPVNTLPSGVTVTPTTPSTQAYKNPTVTGANNYTVSFSEYVNGWTSFHSWIPESMVNMNGDFFTFKSGQLYKHHANDTNRNNFYGATYPSELEFVSNDASGDVKMFKTIEIEGDAKDWDVTIATNLDQGHIDKSSFEKKEGFHYSYIRRNSTDLVNTELLSVQGVGMLISTTTNVYNFTSVPSEISVGDSLYKATSGSYQLIGTISGMTGTSITTSASAVIPSVNDFIFGAKSPVAESYGLKGYFANIKISNTSNSKVEVFAVNSEVSKSFP